MPNSFNYPWAVQPVGPVDPAQGVAPSSATALRLPQAQRSTLKPSGPADRQDAPSATTLSGQVEWDQFDQPNEKTGATGYSSAAPGAVSHPWDEFDHPSPGFVPEAPEDDPNGATKNALTGVMRIPGALLGAPAAIKHADNWAKAKLWNLMTGSNFTGADLDRADPLMKVLPTSEGVDRHVFDTAHVKPYEPTTAAGHIGQAVVTGLGAGLVDPLAVAGDVSRGVGELRAAAGVGANALKTGVASGAAAASQQAFPDNPELAIGAAVLGHTGTSAALAAAKFGGGLAADTARQILSPANQGEREAGRVLAPVDHTQPGLASPTPADLTAAQGGVKTTTDAIGPGLPDWQAGAQLRAGLQGRADTLRAVRAKSADAAYDTFRQQAPLPSNELEPFLKSPSFRKALSAANGAVLDEGGEPLTDFFGLADDNMPSFLTGKAIPTDVLHRIKAQLGDAVNAATPGSAAQRTATMLNNRFADFLEQQYPARGDFPGYAAIRQNYAEASKPLDPMTHGPVEKTLSQDTQFGRSRYTLADERVPDLFLRSGATRADLNQLVDAFGGDKAAATGALEQHLAGVAQGSVRPDGTLDTAAFDKAMAPYQRSMGNVSLWFPNLAGKFSTAKAAQSSLDNLQAQKSLADAVSGGALRDQSGAVSGPSFNRWLASNKEALAKTQNPAAVMRLQSIASALQGTHPGELADAIKSELAPAILGGATGGLEGGVLGTLLHKFTGAAFGGADAKRQAAFSAAIERAVRDPDYAARLTAASSKQGRGLTPGRALVRAIATTPVAVNAGSEARN